MHKTQEMRAVEDHFGRDIGDMLFEYRWGAHPRTLGEIADIFGVHPSTVWLWCKEFELNVKQVAWKYMRDEVNRVRVAKTLHEEDVG